MWIQLIINETETYNVFASPTDTIDEMLRHNGLCCGKEDKFDVTMNGEEIKYFLSLGYQGVVEGSQIHLIAKREPNWYRRIHLSQQNLLICDDEIRNDYYLEAARIADLGFAQWEPTTKFTSVLEEMLKESNQMQEEDEYISFTSATNTCYTHTISEQPLPFCFIYDD